MNFKLKRLGCTLALAGAVFFTLSACGGGGGGSSTPVSAAPTALESATAFAAQQDALFSAAVPASGAALQINADGCFLNNGYTKAINITNFDANVAQAIAANAYRIGSKRSNIRVSNERSITNTDGSTRKEMDVIYDITYADGSIAKDEPQQMISGSSFGSCATPQSSTDWRFFGNQHLVGTNVRARNLRNEQFALATGAPLATAATYRNEVQFNILDPQGIATYAVVTGPGGTTISGVVTPFAFKLLSTRLLKSDPLLAGKNGNFTNWTADDAFRFCRTLPAPATNANNVVPASDTDCTLGANGNGFGWTFGVGAAGATTTQIVSADAGFNSYGFVAGGTYTFKIYNDDGWKTVNGHAGKTPIATYTEVLEKLPYTFAQMIGTNDLNDHKYPRFVATSLPPVQTAPVINSSTASMVSLSWVVPATQADARVFRATEFGEFFQGAKVGNALGVLFPAERYYNPSYLNGNATTINTLAISALPSTIGSKSYTEFSLNYTDRNNSRFVSYASFN